MSFLVQKADGSSEEFAPAKLISSLEHAGATSEDAEQILEKITRELTQKSGAKGQVVSTSELYRHAFEHLRDTRHAAAAKYSLKRAILELGPSGFPFESYIAELFRTEGYTAKVDQIVRGKCVEHEVDVVLEKNGVKTYVEAKFHNTLGFKTDLKVVLYVQARTEDIAKGEGLVVTNTSFTSKAVEYATCAGLNLLGWDYPQTGNLHERIDKAGLYPVTALTTLTRREKMALLNERVVLSKAIAKDPMLLRHAGVPHGRAQTVLEEIATLCGSEK